MPREVRSNKDSQRLELLVSLDSGLRATHGGTTRILLNGASPNESRSSGILSYSGMKKFITICSGFFFIVGIALLMLPKSWFPSFYDPRYMGVASIAGVLLIQLLPSA